MKKIKLILIIIIGILLVGSAGFYVWKDIGRFGNTENIEDNKNNTASSTAQDDPLSRVTIKPIPLEQDMATGKESMAPSLDRAIPAGTNKDVVDNINRISGELKKDPTNIDNWIVLGIYRKTATDYLGAEEAWKYAAFAAPQASTPFNNLADLYAYYLKDNKKAEEYFRKAVDIDPKQTYIYQSFYEFYRFVLKDDAKAKAILQEAAQNNPTAKESIQRAIDSF